MEHAFVQMKRCLDGRDILSLVTRDYKQFTPTSPLCENHALILKQTN